MSDSLPVTPPDDKPAPVSSRSATPGNDNAAAPAPDRPAVQRMPLVMLVGFSVVVVILMITVLILWRQVDARDTTILERQNRNEQAEASVVRMNARLDDNQAITDSLQTKLREAETAAELSLAALARAKADTAANQTLLDQARLKSTELLMQMEAAKVTAYQHQGEVAVAQAKSTVLETQLAKARSDIVGLNQKLAEAEARITDLQGELEQAKKAPAPVPQSRTR